jgi:hypothetical protein
MHPESTSAGRFAARHCRGIRLATAGSFVVAALCISASAPASAASIGITAFDGIALQQNGEPATQAGSHPAVESVAFSFATALTPGGNLVPLEDPRDTVFELPAGLLADPYAVEACSASEFAAGPRSCPPESQVGVFTLETLQESSPVTNLAPLYNLKPPLGTTALLGFYINTTPVTIAARLRSGGDYGLTMTSANIQESMLVAGGAVEFWGVPASPSHDALRGSCLPETGSPSGQLCPSADAADPKAFFTLPTSCTGPIRTGLTVLGWQGGIDSASFLSHDNTLPTPTPIGNDGCNALDFKPTLKARPTTNVADSPTGFEVDLHIPQDAIADPTGTVEAHLKDAGVTLPEGLVISPSGANGLTGCSSTQIGFKGFNPQTQIDEFTPGPANCPDASKVGTVEVDTPLLDHPAKGAVYVATPHDNPFNSLLAIYIAVDDLRSGVVVKLAGRVEPDPVTGRLSSTFANNPQLPFEHFKLDFFGGAGALLKTPATCGTYSTASSLTPWSAPDSGPPAGLSDAYAIDQSPAGAGCATTPETQPHAPSFDAGTISPIAGARSPFVVKLHREDGSQQLSSLSLTTPPGLTADLSRVPYCPEVTLAALSAAPGSGRAEVDHPSCPAAGLLGTASLAAGPGPGPYHVGGTVYLAGPYRGAPLSLAIVVPAVVGPFDLGTVLLRAAVRVDPLTAQLSIDSDPLPEILSGIPLDLRGIEIRLDRPGFVRNPTSCERMSITGTATSLRGAGADLSNPFQVGDCANLGFKPRLALGFSGATGRNGHPTVTAVLRSHPGEAHLRRTAILFPRGEYLDQRQIRGVCTRSDFSAGSCPAGSAYGRVRAWSPLLAQPLQGPVYLRESDRRLPDLAADLQGQVHLVLGGHLDASHVRVRAGFDRLPDIPFSRLELVLSGGRRGLLVSSRSLCGDDAVRATATFVAHNGKGDRVRPLVRATCGK